MKKETLEYIAKLARLDLSSDELDSLANDMTSIIELMDTIKDINVDDLVYDNAFVNKNNNSFESNCSTLRKDEPFKPMEIDDILKNTSFKLENSFVVPKVVE